MATTYDVVEKLDELNSTLGDVAKSSDLSDINDSLQQLVNDSDLSRVNDTLQDLVEKSDLSDVNESLQILVKNSDLEDINASLQELVEKSDLSDINDSIQELVNDRDLSRINDSLQELVNDRDLSHINDSLAELSHLEDIDSSLQTIANNSDLTDVNASLQAIVQGQQELKIALTEGPLVKSLAAIAETQCGLARVFEQAMAHTADAQAAADARASREENRYYAGSSSRNGDAPAAQAGRTKEQIDRDAYAAYQVAHEALRQERKDAFFARERVIALKEGQERIRAASASGRSRAATNESPAKKKQRK